MMTNRKGGGVSYSYGLIFFRFVCCHFNLFLYVFSCGWKSLVLFFYLCDWQKFIVCFIHLVYGYVFLAFDSICLRFDTLDWWWWWGWRWPEKQHGVRFVHHPFIHSMNEWNLLVLLLLFFFLVFHHPVSYHT